MNSDHYRVSSTANSVTVSWNKQHVQEKIVSEEINKYETKYRKTGESWYTLNGYNEGGESKITGLLSDTSYEINVYWCAESGDSHKLFTAPCKTKKSNTSLQENARADKSRRPIVYHLNPVHTADYEFKVKTKNNLDFLRNKDGSCVVDRFRICDMSKCFVCNEFVS